MESLTVDYSITSEHLLLTVAMALGVTCYITYWFVVKSKKIKEYFFKKNESTDTAWTRYVFSGKLFGFIMLGIIPLSTVLMLFPNLSLKYFGIYFNSDTALFSVVWILILWIPIIALTSNYMRAAESQEIYPHDRSARWNTKRLFLSLFGWFIYVLGYEFLFRGVLLIPMIDIIGLWPAITINIALYCIVHIPKGVQDVLGSALMGIALCILTVESGMIWTAFFLHVSIGVTSTILGIKFNEGMTFSKESEIA